MSLEKIQISLPMRSEERMISPSRHRSHLSAIFCFCQSFSSLYSYSSSFNHHQLLLWLWTSSDLNWVFISDTKIQLCISLTVTKVKTRSDQKDLCCETVFKCEKLWNRKWAELDSDVCHTVTSLVPGVISVVCVSLPVGTLLLNPVLEFSLLRLHLPAYTPRLTEDRTHYGLHKEVCVLSWGVFRLALNCPYNNETLKSLFWIGANFHHPVDLPDTTGLNWREAIIRCLESVNQKSNQTDSKLIQNT